ncbi:MAG: ATP-dependent DNA helicase RecG [bacterium ADurb.Bin429]|nr:MAG: ATP-dependent DNA helicase RecG [bacterium ADurb.Bin429]
MVQSGEARYWQQLRKPLELELEHDCPDDAIIGLSISEFAQRWAERCTAPEEEDRRLALSVARGLRDYATMTIAERRRRTMAAIDLLRRREANSIVALPISGKKKAQAKRPATPRAAKKGPPPAPLPAGQELLEMSISELAPRARWPMLLAKLNLYTVRDLLYHIPREWLTLAHIADLPDGARAAIVGEVADRQVDRLQSRTAPQPLYKYTLTVRDDSGEAWVTSITMEAERPRGGARQPWTPNKLNFPVGQRVFVMGKVERTGKLVELRMEDIFQLTAAEGEALRPGVLVPLYPLTNGVYQNQVHRAVLRVFAALQDDTEGLPDPLPAEMRERYGLLPILAALRELHQPTNNLQHEQARKRLAFEEFLIIQLVLAQRRMHAQQQHGTMLHGPEALSDLVARMAPFEPTLAQLRVLGEIEDDLRGARPMNRLLQGDVGSGKTLIAAAALAFAHRAGFQAAIMAPTEILAEQLYLVLTRLMEPLGIAPTLLVGGMAAGDRRVALEALANGDAPIAVGTHALIQEGVKFKRLGLVVVDEQHRFGVLQRATLRGKGRVPNTLVMTATPIPRTLALTLYGDLDISVLDELPPGRREVETRWLSITEIREAYDEIRAQVAQGRQAYVLCPLVEQSDLLQADAAVEMAEELRKRVFPDLKVGLLHGRMKSEEKAAAMEDFRAGLTHILACTTVIEVGVDVPNATLILIHNAERFGLAQLHQLRGRVGRSKYPSTCVLVTHPRFDPAQPEEDLPARRRLKAIIASQDGFQIADTDLQIRGPGEFLGTRQSGLLDFHIGNLLRDGKNMEQARQAAMELLHRDPGLACCHDLARRVGRLKVKLDQFLE